MKDLVLLMKLLMLIRLSFDRVVFYLYFLKENQTPCALVLLSDLLLPLSDMTFINKYPSHQSDVIICY